MWGFEKAAHPLRQLGALARNGGKKATEGIHTTEPDVIRGGFDARREELGIRFERCVWRAAVHSTVAGERQFGSHMIRRAETPFKESKAFECGRSQAGCAL